MAHKKEVKKSKDKHEHKPSLKGWHSIKVPPHVKLLPKEEHVEKAVGEMLKEEGIIQDVPETEERSSLAETGNAGMDRVVMEVEKLREVVNTLKSIKFEADERIKELAESIGEVRSLFFQRDSTITEMERNMDILKTAIEDIQPEKFRKMIEARDKDMNKMNLNFEKMNKVFEDVNERLGKTERVLDKVRNVEDIDELNREVHDYFDKIKNLKWAVERDSAKSERFFLESEKKFKDLTNMQMKLEQTEELARETLKDLDSTKIKIEAFVSREDVLKEIDDRLKVGTKKEVKVAEQTKRKEEIEILLKNLDNQYDRGLISKESYQEIKEKNLVVLEDIEKEIERIQTEREPTNINEWSKIIEDGMENLRINLEFNKEKIDAVQSLMEVRRPPRVERLPRAEKKEPEEKTILDKEIREIEELLTLVDEQYHEGFISKKSYDEIRMNNLDKIKELKKGYLFKKGKDSKIAGIVSNLEKKYRKKRSPTYLGRRTSMRPDMEDNSMKRSQYIAKMEKGSMGKSKDRSQIIQHYIPEISRRTGTRIDALYDMLTQYGKLNMGDVMKRFRISKGEAIEWSKVLIHYGLAKLQNAASEEPTLVRKTMKIKETKKKK